MRKAIAVIRNESGAALMMALFTVTMLMVIASEVMYETNVELAVSGQAINQVKAHYAAKAGVEISLLRIHIYRKAAAMVGNALPNKSILDPIWKVPFAWPPPIPKEVSVAERDQINAAVKLSSMQGTYAAIIESENSKIDINDLASPVKSIAENTKNQIKKIFSDKMEADEAFQRKHGGYDFDKLVGAIKDWVDEDKTQEGGSGDEGSLYTDLGESGQYPPNTGFKTFQEIHMVSGMTDEFYEILLPRITLFGAKGINVKFASKSVLMSLSPQFTEKVVDRILEERSKQDTTAFKDVDSFLGFMKNQLSIEEAVFRDPNTKEWKIPIILDDEFNFRILSEGRSGKVNRTITAVVFDFDRVSARLKELAPKPSPTPTGPTQPAAPTPPGQTPTPAPTPTPAGGGTPKTPSERPNIVYWNET